VANNNKNPKVAAKPEPEPVTRLQRALTFMAGSVGGLGVLALFALLIAEGILGQTPAGVKQFDANPIWGTLSLLIPMAITIGFLLFIVVVILRVVARSRAAKGDGQ
jgi:hypothetical protein